MFAQRRHMIISFELQLEVNGVYEAFTYWWISSEKLFTIFSWIFLHRSVADVVQCGIKHKLLCGTSELYHKENIIQF